MEVISLFSGAGGLDLGFVKAGAEIIWANDIWADAAETYRKNIGNHIIVADIRQLNTKSIPEAEVIIGGFPCLGFTIAKGKNRRPDDPYNFLYKEYLRLVNELKPRAFLIENVTGMAQGNAFKSLFESMINGFKKVGYLVLFKILNAADYGVPQKRRRILILGTRNDLNATPRFPEITHSKYNTLEKTAPWITLRDAIGDLPEDFDPLHDPEHVGSSHVVKINGYVGNRKLSWDEPSPTITGRGSRTGGPVIHPHPSLQRRLSVKECKRLQSFPDDFEFKGSISSMYAQIGNAVPPLLAFRVAQELIRSLGESPKKYKPEEWELPWKNKIPPT